MATIENHGFVTRDRFIAEIRKMDDGSLIAQQLVQQGSINAVAFLLKNGCTPDLAQKMLTSLRENMQLVREEAARRSGVNLFEEDQTGFN